MEVCYQIQVSVLVRVTVRSTEKCQQKHFLTIRFLGTSWCTGDSGGSMTFETEKLHYIRGIASATLSLHNETTQQIECDLTGSHTICHFY